MCNGPGHSREDRLQETEPSLQGPTPLRNGGCRKAEVFERHGRILTSSGAAMGGLNYLRVGCELLGTELSFAISKAEHALHYHVAAFQSIGSLSAISVEHDNEPLFAAVPNLTRALLYIHRDQSLAFKSARVSPSSRVFEPILYLVSDRASRPETRKDVRQTH